MKYTALDVIRQRYQKRNLEHDPRDEDKLIYRVMVEEDDIKCDRGNEVKLGTCTNDVTEAM